MSVELFFGKGSKRRVRKIRWKTSEVASLLLLGLGITALGIATALWMIGHLND